jgi:hypothetical protein
MREVTRVIPVMFVATPTMPPSFLTARAVALTPRPTPKPKPTPTPPFGTDQHGQRVEDETR